MMEIVQKNKALIVPQTIQHDFGSGPTSFAHGVVRGQDDPAYFSHMRSGRPLLNQALQSAQLTQQPAKLAGKWLYLGGLHTHFGHFLSECIHRAWAWGLYRDQCRGALFLPNVKEYDLDRHLPGYAKDILGLFGLDESNIRYITELTEVDELVIPEPGSQLFKPVSNEYLRYLSTLQLGERLANQPLPDNFSPKVFVSRKNFRMRAIAGLHALEPSLQNEGYFIFYPEMHPVLTQLKVYSQAEKIIVEEGSAIHLFELFNRIDADVVVISRRPETKQFNNIVRARTTHFVNYNQVILLPSLSGDVANNLPITDIRKLADFLIEHGFAPPSLAVDPDWTDNVKIDIFNFLLKHAEPSAPIFKEKVIDYLRSVNKFFKHVEAYDK